MQWSVYQDVGRDYADAPGVNPHFRLRPLPQNDWAGHPTEFNVTVNGKLLSQPVWYAHLALLKLCKHYQFDRVLDLGGNEGLVAHVFDHLGKETVMLEPYPYRVQAAPGYSMRKIDVERNYEEVIFDRKFDAIWCSHVLEHVRNPGSFLDKIYDDLREGGVLALTIPFNDFNDSSLTTVLLGHHNKYNQWLVLYQLVCAGFDCREAAVAIYAGQISVIVRKKPNNLRRASAALYSPYPPRRGEPLKEGEYDDPRVYDFFPFQWQGTSYDSREPLVNWGIPI